MPDFLAPLARVSARHGARETFASFCQLAACALAAGTREEEYLAAARRFDRAELDAFAQALALLVGAMEISPFEDLLGPAYMDSLGRQGQQWRGEFHTPAPVCRLMARLLVGDCSGLPATGPVTVCEPACGSGAMILALVEACPPELRRRLRVTAIDISRTACDMCFINTTLWGVPCRVHHGNALSLEFWAAWSNLHHVAPWLAAGLSPPPQGRAPDVHEATALRRALRAEQLPLNLEAAP